jgi:hypothetical protein
VDLSFNPIFQTKFNIQIAIAALENNPKKPSPETLSKTHLQ